MTLHNETARPPKGTGQVAAGGPGDETKCTSTLGPVHDALTYTAWGWHVLPIRAGAKLPATAHGFHDATDDPDRVLDWWDTQPAYGVGVATGEVSGLVVLDVDPGGLETLRGLVAEVGPLPRTLAVHTPRGGLHGYYRHPGGRRVRCSAGKLGPNLDVRGDGGYVVAPPSTVDGKPYRWRDDPWPEPALADLPAQWVELLTAEADPPVPVASASPLAGVSGRAARYVEAAVRGELEDVAAAVEGTRNHRLNAAAFRLGALAATGALDAGAARQALAAAAAVCGLGQREAARTIDSGLTSGLAQPAELPSERVAA